MASGREAVERTVERLVDEVGGWPRVTVGDHRFGGTEFRVGPREIGHVHARGMLDVSYPRELRDVLVDEGHAGVHHLLTESGWTTYYVESADEYDHARWLLRLSYLSLANVLQNTPAGAEELTDVDVDAGLDALDPSDDVRAAFERRSS